MTDKAFFEIPGGSGSNNCQDGNFLGVDRFTHGCAAFAVGLRGYQSSIPYIPWLIPPEVLKINNPESTDRRNSGKGYMMTLNLSQLGPKLFNYLYSGYPIPNLIA